MSERLRIVLELDDKGFVKGVVSNNKRLASLGKHVRDLDRTIGSAEKRTVSWGKKLRDVTVTLASLNYIIPNLTNVMFGWQRQILNSNAELEQSVAIMKNFSTATNEVNATLEANNFVDKIIRKAGEAPFSINALTDSMVKLRVSGIEKVNQGFDALVDSVAAFGGTDAQLKRASVAMQQMGSKGVISMEELRQQLGEAVPKAIQLMARGLGTTYGKLVKQISLGNVKAQGAMSAMLQEMELALGGSAIRMMDTYKGLTAQMQTEMTNLMRILAGDTPDGKGGTVEGSGYFSALKKEMKSVVELMRSNEFKTFAADVGKGMKSALYVLKDFVTLIKDNINLLTNFAKGFAVFYAGKKAIEIAQLGLTKYHKALSVVKASTKDVNTVVERHGKMLSRNTDIYKQQLHQVKKSNIALGKRRDMFAYTTRAEIDQARQMTKSNMIMKRRIVTMKLMGRAMKGLAVTAAATVAAVAGPLMIAGLAAMAFHWRDQKNAIQENIDKLVEYNGVYATTEQIKAVRTRIAEIKEMGDLTAIVAEKQQALNDAREKQARVGKLSNVQGNSGGLALRKSIDTAREELNKVSKLPKELADLETSLLRAVDSLSRSMADAGIRRIKSAFVDAMFTAQKEYDRAREELQKRMDSENAPTQKEADKERTQYMLKYAKAQLQEWQRLLAETQAGFNKVKGQGAEVVRAKASELVEIHSNIERLKDALADPKLYRLKEVLGEDTDSAASKKNTAYKVDMVTRKLNALRGELKKLESVADGATALGEFEKFWTGLGDTAKLDDVKKLKGEFQSLFAMIDEQKGMNRVLSDFDKFVAKSHQAGEVASLAFTQKVTHGLEIVTKHTNQYQVAMQTLSAAIDKYVGVKDKQRAAEMKATLESIKGTYQMMDLSEMYSSITRKADMLAKRLGKHNDTQEEYYDSLIKQARAMLGAVDENTQGYDELSAAVRRYIMLAKEMRDVNSLDLAVRNHVKEWGDLERGIQSLTINALDGFADFFGETLSGASASFSEFAESMIKDLTKIIAKMIIFRGLEEVLGWNSPQDKDTPSNSVTPFAKGGIMTDKGSLPLHLYAKGGIANSPQLAMFGEGSTPEAYVPLPDGRTIPVTMRGGMSNVEVNVINKTSQPAEATANTRWDGEKMMVDVMLKNINKPGRVREALKGVS